MRLTFHLAGINNQNFLMRDEETGTYWQQISGAAISGPLKGSQLTLVHSDELTLATWKSEQPEGTVLDDVPTLVGRGRCPASTPLARSYRGNPRMQRNSIARGNTGRTNHSRQPGLTPSA